LDQQITEIAAAWPALPEAVRGKVLALVRAAMNGAGPK
jgi:hypothetical protein